MYNDLFSIGPFTIHGYGLMIAIGIISAYFTAEHLAKKNGLDPEMMFGLAISVVAAGFAGSKLLYIITVIPEIIKDPSYIKNVTSGWVVYGSLIGGIIALFIYCRVRKINPVAYMDVTLPAVALGQGFGRIGCFLAGCCYGMETDSSFCVIFSHSDYAPNGVPLFPSQLVSSALNFLNFAVLFLILKKKPKTGVTSACYLLFYSIGRFCIEFFRGDLERGSVGIFSTSQFIAIWTAVFSVILFIFSNRKKGARID
ncbi:MAG: prolipoprotein diacylglyceryl transferase [Lachnospiraceae bacterium]|nr:prolipoprotein diacylglyceryl transferase [Lachnospiraceae bacterium]